MELVTDINLLNENWYVKKLKSQLRCKIFITSNLIIFPFLLQSYKKVFCRYQMWPDVCESIHLSSWSIHKDSWCESPTYLAIENFTLPYVFTVPTNWVTLSTLSEPISATFFTFSYIPWSSWIEQQWSYCISWVKIFYEKRVMQVWGGFRWQIGTATGDHVWKLRKLLNIGHYLRNAYLFQRIYGQANCYSSALFRVYRLFCIIFWLFYTVILHILA